VLLVHIKPWGKLFVDGEELTSANNMDFVKEMASGKHTLRAEHPKFGSQTLSVNLAVEETKELKIDLRERGAQ
jgi:hypothetical protein